MKNSVVIAIALITFYGILTAHPIDIHLPTSEEFYLLDQEQKKHAAEKANEILADPTATMEEKEKALDVYCEYNGIAVQPECPRPSSNI